MTQQLVKFMRCSRSLGRSFVRVWLHENRLGVRTFASTDRNQLSCASAIRLFHGYHRHSRSPNRCEVPMLLGASLAFLGFFEKEEEKEPLLITTIKRSILLVQKGEFKKAEQMLHVALRQAQSLQDENGITYVYDVMANLAFDVGEFDKALKLFQSVMRRELSKGTPQDDPKIVHMSLKMAKILEQKGLYKDAELGYQYCEKILEEQIKKGTEDVDIITLWVMNLDWYGRMLLAERRYSEAMGYMEKVYQLCVKINGEEHEQSVIYLNDLGSISFLRGKYDDAFNYLSKAIELGEKLSDLEDLSSIYVNLGNVYVKKNLLDKAKRCCSRGWRLSKSRKDKETLEEAEACLEEINKLLTT